MSPAVENDLTSACYRMTISHGIRPLKKLFSVNKTVVDEYLYESKNIGGTGRKSSALSLVGPRLHQGRVLVVKWKENGTIQQHGPH